MAQQKNFKTFKYKTFKNLNDDSSVLFCICQNINFFSLCVVVPRRMSSSNLEFVPKDRNTG